MKLSIVTPTFNSEQFISKTIDCIAKQTYLDFEHIVVDGASTDNTIHILNGFDRVEWISEADRGQSDAINKGFQLATGDILAWQNADDLYYPETFQTVVDFFAKNPDIDLVYGDYMLIDVHGNEICKVEPPNWNHWLFAHGRFVPLQPTVFWRRQVYETVGELRVDLHYCMDVDFFARAAKQFRFAKIPQLLGQFRIHADSKTQNSENERIVRQEHKKVLQENYEYTYIDNMIFGFFAFRSRFSKMLQTKTIR